MKQEDTPLDSFLNCIDNAYHTTGDWLEREVIFACAAGVCGAYFRLNLPLSVQQTILLARKLFEVYINTLNTPHYLISLNIPSLKKEMLDLLQPLESSVTFSFNDISLGIDDRKLEFLANVTFKEIVLESLQVSLIAFCKKISVCTKSLS